MKFVIKQLNTGKKCPKYLFMSYDYAIENRLSLKDYRNVYCGDINVGLGVEGTLEHLFVLFNHDLPKDYSGHSLSVSDVVELDGVNYYCDSIGWKRIDNDLL